MLPSEAEKVLEARDFVKNYSHVPAVKGVSLSLNRGEIFGLIGPDGSGKTSLIRSFVSLLEIDGGELFFKGRSVAENPEYVRRNIGYMPQRFSLYQDLTVEENLRFFADLFDVPREESRRRREELYGFSGLKPFARRKAGALSGGMKQKLALSCMLIHSPDVIILDEPTFGVDPVSRSEFWQILARLKKEGTSLLVSTAYMDEAGLCDRVALMFEGEILEMGCPEELERRYPEPLYAVRTSDPHLVHDVLEKSELCGECHLFGEGVHLTLRSGASLEGIEAVLKENGQAWDYLGPMESGMEDLFLRLMNGGSHD